MAQIQPQNFAKKEIEESKVVPEKNPSNFYCCVLAQNIVSILLCCWGLGIIGIFLLAKSECGVQKDKIYRANKIGLAGIFGGIIVAGILAVLIFLLIMALIPECVFIASIELILRYKIVRRFDS